jgi:chaperonin GroEL (HSP60 family)
MGAIEVGADSDLSQKLIKDAVDDAIKAAASAFNHGIVKGCNIDMIRTIKYIRDNYWGTSPETYDLTMTLIDILLCGFRDIYRTVLSNAFPDRVLFTKNDVDYNGDIYKLAQNKLIEIFHKDIFESITVDNKEEIITGILIYYIFECDLHDLLISISAETGMVFDVSTKEFSNDIVNSAQTDEEILIATIDLISLLITGNQMLITQKHNF